MEPENRKALIAKLASHAEEDRRLAMEALKGSLSEDDLQWLIRPLSDESWRVRKEGIEGLEEGLHSATLVPGDPVIPVGNFHPGLKELPGEIPLGPYPAFDVVAKVLGNGGYGEHQVGFDLLDILAYVLGRFNGTLAHFQGIHAGANGHNRKYPGCMGKAMVPREEQE